MVNKKTWLGILAMVLVFGMTVVGCDDGSGDGNADGSGFTLNGIPSEYNGKYALFGGAAPSVGQIMGAETLNYPQSMTLPKITNGSVTIPGWILQQGGLVTVKYTGNDTLNVYFSIYDTVPSLLLEGAIVSVTFTSVTFTSGEATKNWSDGTIQ
jgi:hypothetical protein